MYVETGVRERVIWVSRDRFRAAIATFGALVLVTLMLPSLIAATGTSASVMASPLADDDAKERRKLRTNELGKDAFEIEGEVISVHCGRMPPELVIGTVDGPATIRIMRNKKKDDDLDCDEVHRGDYIKVEYAHKHHEGLYDGYKFELDHECDDDENENGECGDDHDDHADVRGNRRGESRDGHGDHGHDQRRDGAHGHQVYETVVMITAGAAATITAGDGLVIVQIGAGTIAQTLELTIRSSEHPASEPPGAHVGEITFEIAARDGGEVLARLPAAVTVIARYHDDDVEDLDERRFALAAWEAATSQWLPLPSVASPDSNQVSALSARLGTYALYQRR